MIDVSILISIVSVGIAVLVALTNIRRNNKADDRKDATELTAVIVKLENINDDTKEIKNELKNVRTEVGELRERVIVAEQTSKSLHRRVDAFEARLEQANKDSKKANKED